MHWKDRLPHKLGDVKDTPDGFSMAVPIPVDDAGYFGRACPACERLFKMLHIEYEALPDDLELTCPYCGERQDHSEFLTADQLERMRSAGLAAAEQYVHDALGDMLQRTFGRSANRSRGSLLSIEWSYRPGNPPMPSRLYEYVEEQVRRTFTCRRCGTHTAVYGAAAFCPVCGPREAVEEVCEAIATQRLALALPDQLSEDLREQARAAGVFDQHAESAIKEVVTLFETFTRSVFTNVVSGADAILRSERRTAFQNLADTERLFTEHARWSVAAAVGATTWARLGVTFEKRHLLTHRHGQVDQRYLNQVQGSRLRIGQRLIITRQEAEQAMANLEAVITAIDRWRWETNGRAHPVEIDPVAVVSDPPPG